MNNMFRGAKAFDQDLGWFVCDGVNLELAFWKGPHDVSRRSEDVTSGTSPGNCQKWSHEARLARP